MLDEHMIMFVSFFLVVDICVCTYHEAFAI